MTLDATGHNITFDGGGKVTVFAGNGSYYSNIYRNHPVGDIVYTGAFFIFKHLTLNSSAGNAVSIGVAGSVTATDCTFSNATGSAIGFSAPLYNSGVLSASVSNCVFTNNQAVAIGGGAPRIVSATRCTFLNNAGAISCQTGTLTGCVFAGNTVTVPAGTSAIPAIHYGGAVEVQFAGTITNCAFLNNHIFAGDYASVSGGALDLLFGTVTNCTFVGNSVTAGRNSSAKGGAFSGAAYARCTLTNCTFANNSATGGQGGSGTERRYLQRHLQRHLQRRGNAHAHQHHSCQQHGQHVRQQRR